MKNKGFTLIELLAVIIVLSLVVTIAFTSINSFSNGFKKKQKENIIKNIEEAASKYAFDTGKTLVFVDELIKNGYYVLNEEDNIINPENGEKLNCYVVESVKQGTYYKSSFKNDTKYELANGNCDISKITIANNNINIELYNNGSKVNNVNNWLKSNNISLKAISSSININCTTNKCVWTSTSGIKEEGSNTVSVNNSKLLKTKYTFQYSEYTNESTKRYTAVIELKIDNEPPIIHNDEIIIYEKDKVTSTKEVEIVASDGNGSGINGYYIGNSTNCSSVSYKSSKVLTVSANGNYTICVKDAVGNYSKSNVQITNIG